MPKESQMNPDTARVYSVKGFPFERDAHFNLKELRI